MKLTIKRLALILALAVILINITPYGAAFAIPENNILSLSASYSGGKVSIRGTTSPNVLAVAVLLYDTDGTTLLRMKTFGVTNGAFSGDLDVKLAYGTYTVRAADYEGGDYATAAFPHIATDSDGGTKEKNGGSGQTTITTPESADNAKIHEGENGSQDLQVIVDQGSNTCSASLEPERVAQLLSSNEDVVITMPTISDVNTYSLELPADSLTNTNETGSLTLATDIGNITFSGNMLSMIDAAGKTAVITIAEADKSRLPADLKAEIGDRPVIQLSITLDGEEIQWNNPDSPVMVSVPYKPTDEELSNPEHIVVWYLDSNGNVVAVPSGRYDSATRSVVFSTTHFSRYAVTYVQKTFDDLETVLWAKKPIEVMASKGIINGTSKNTFSPLEQIKRADYLLLLIKTLGLTAEFETNFEDVMPSAYYYRAVGTAKKLGITTGTGNNRFNPNENITRQDMMVLTTRVFEKYRGLKTTSVDGILDSFIDSTEISDYARGSMATLVNEELILGFDNRTNPKSDTTRAEAAVFLYRMYNKYPE
jgi:hypothetical protein